MIEDNHSTSSGLIAILNEKLLSLESIIACQKEEILKSESSISIYRSCLDKQNEALNKYISEKQKLEFERAKRLKLSIVDDKKCQEVYDSVLKMGIQSKNKRRINRETFKLFDNVVNDTMKAETQLLSQNEDYTIDTKEDILPQTTSKSPVESLQSNENIPDSKVKTILKRLQVAHTTNQTITTIVACGNEICLGGSNGLLLKYSNNRTQLYDTDTNDDITQIEVLKEGQKFNLIAFTREKILIFKGMGNVRQDISLSGIGNVFVDVNVIYIPLRNGPIKKLYSDSRAVVDYAVHEHGELSCFVPGTGINKCALVSTKDGLLYKTDKKELKTLEMVDDVSNIRRIMRIRYCNFLCYSDQKIWFLNSRLQVMSTVEFEGGIKFVDATYTSGAVIDVSNTVYIYRVLDSGCFGPMVSERTLEGDVSALCIVKKNVIVAIGCDVFAIENIF